METIEPAQRRLPFPLTQSTQDLRSLPSKISPLEPIVRFADVGPTATLLEYNNGGYKNATNYRQENRANIWSLPTALNLAKPEPKRLTQRHQDTKKNRLRNGN